MIAVAVTTLFAATALLALATIGASLHRHGRSALALRGQLADCADRREVRARVTEVRVRSSATVLRPAFRQAAQRPARPARALPAAA